MARVTGVETEYGLAARSDGRRLEPDDAARRLFAPLARARGSTNVFLPGGGRLYLDVGDHPEYAPPECLDAHALVVAQRAGDVLLTRLADAAVLLERDQGRDTTFWLTRNNVDAAGHTWGSHTNHLVPRNADPHALTDWLVGYLVSRGIVSGAGRWRRGRFTHTQRGDVLGDVVSRQTTRDRPLINTRDEPHADPSRFRRLHILAGDTLTLDVPSWLALATTDLVLDAALAGGPPPPGPADPLAALRRWNTDPSTPVAATQGPPVTAFDVQRRLLDAAGEHAVSAEHRRVLACWRTVLDDVAAGRPSGAEWDVKRRLLLAWQASHGARDDDPRLDALDLNWHEIGDAGDRPRGAARLIEARGRVPRLTTDDEVRSALATPPSATRARVRGRLVEAADAFGRDITVDWERFTVHDLIGPQGRDQEMVLDLADPRQDTSPEADGLVAAMEAIPRSGLLRGFRPPTTR